MCITGRLTVTQEFVDGSVQQTTITPTGRPPSPRDHRLT